jgi:hypothetical protein
MITARQRALSRALVTLFEEELELAFDAGEGDVEIPYDTAVLEALAAVELQMKEFWEATA